MSKHFTFVTAFYRLDDNSIQSGRFKSYIESGNQLMNSGHNIVAFTEPDLAPFFRSLNRKDNVVIVPLPKSLLPNIGYLPKIVKDRQDRQYAPDPRNTPEYFAITCSKPWFVKKAIELNLFRSTHFAWSDFGLYKTCRTSESLFDQIIEARIELVNVSILNSHPEELCSDIPKYYEFGRPGLGGTFWSGSLKSMERYCELAIDKFNHMVELGYGHADEQIMFQVYNEHPDLFRCYPADYVSIIENAVRINNIQNVSDCLTRISQSKRRSLLNNCLQICHGSGIPC